MSDILKKFQTLYSTGWVTEAHLQRWIDSVLPMAEAQEFNMSEGTFRLFRMGNNTNTFRRTDEVLQYIRLWGEKIYPATPEQLSTFLSQFPSERVKDIAALGQKISNDKGDQGYLVHTPHRGEICFHLESGPSAQGREQDYAGLWTGHTYFLVEML